MVRRKLESGYKINYKEFARLHMKMATFIGENPIIRTRKDMEHLYGLMDTDSLGSTRRVSSTAMEYLHGQMEVFIMGNTKMIKERVTHITSGPMAMSIMDSTKKDISGEKGYSKKKAYYTKIDM
jgi:hypothetical protein